MKFILNNPQLGADKLEIVGCSSLTNLLFILTKTKLGGKSEGV